MTLFPFRIIAEVYVGLKRVGHNRITCFQRRRRLGSGRLVASIPGCPHLALQVGEVNEGGELQSITVDRSSELAVGTDVVTRTLPLTK